MDSFLALLVGLIVGIAFAIWDNKSGKKWYRKWHNLTNQHPLPEGSEATFVQHQPFSRKLVSAICISLVVAVVFYFGGVKQILFLALNIALAFVGILASFYLYPLIFKGLKGKMSNVKEAVEKLDKVEEKLEDLMNKKNMAKPSKRPNPIDNPPIEKDNSTEKSKKEATKNDESHKDKGGDWRSGVKDFLDK